MSEFVQGSTTWRIQTADLSLPSAGAWRVEVVADSGEAPTPGNAATFRSGTLTLSGKVARAGLDHGGKPHATIFGGLGWESLVAKPLSFQSSSGVRLSTVLSSVASGAGESINPPSDRTIGDYFELVASTATNAVRWSTVLDRLVRANILTTWRVDFAGTTQFDVPPSSKPAGRTTLVDRSSGVGAFIYSIDDPADVAPGKTLPEGTVSRATVHEEASKTTATVWLADATSAPPLRETIRRMVSDALIERIRTYVVYASHDDGTLDLQPPSDATHLPELRGIKQWCLGGILYKPSKGDEVVVLFRDDVGTRPVVIGFEQTSATISEIARKGDTVKVPFPPLSFVGTIGGQPATGMALSSIPFTLGQIDTGSSTLKARG